MLAHAFFFVEQSLEEHPVTHFVVLPNLQEDEGMLRETLKNLCRSPFGREIRAHCVDHEDPRGSEHFKDKAESLMARRDRLCCLRRFGRHESRPNCSPSAEKYVHIVLAMEACESLNTQVKAERSAWSSALNRTVDQIVEASFPSLRRYPLKILAALVLQRNTCTLCWPFEACESVGSNTQDRVEHLTAETGHHLEDVIATCHQPGVVAQVAGNSSST